VEVEPELPTQGRRIAAAYAVGLLAFGLCLAFNGPSSSSISQRDGGLHSDLRRIGEGACSTTGVLGGSPGGQMTALIDLIHTWSIAHLQAILGNQRNFTRRMYLA
jgi:hypothetical protein